MIKKLLLLTSLIICSSMHANASINWREFDIEITKMFQESKIPGMAVAVVSKNKILYIKPFGVKQINTPYEVDTHTIFRVASLSKAMSAAIIAKFVEEGEISWYTKLYKIDKRFKLNSFAATQKITITNILNHSFGYTGQMFAKHIEDGKSIDEIREINANTHLTKVPGTTHRYQNFIYNYAQIVIEQISNKSFEQNIQDIIFTPLQMNDASIGASNYILNQNKALPHLHEKNEYYISSKIITSKYYIVPAAAGVNASISDMAKWVQTLLGGNPQQLSTDLIAKLTTPSIKIDYSQVEENKKTWEDYRVKSKYYGLGLRIFDYADERLITHAGMLGGFSSYMGFMPSQDLGIIVLSNSNSTIPSEIVARFFDYILGLQSEYLLRK